ncbi:MAG TPA: response regulator [Polyangiaceae bacterium]|jgi:signal transduction histidine kinase/CheY-like chemotaxis protein
MGGRVLPADLRKPLERALGDMVPAALACAAAIMAVNAVFDTVLLPAAIRGRIVAFDIGTAALCAAGRAALGKWPRPDRMSDAIAVAVGTLLAANALETMRQTHDLVYTAHVVLLIVCAGSILESSGWLLAFMLVVLGGWTVVAFASAPGLSLLAPAFSLLAAAAAGAAFHWARVRAFAKIGLLRARDRIRGERLRNAFSATRHELEQRKSAEVEGKRLREQLLHAQKMDAVGRLAGGVAHDMNNVLTSITTVGELLLEDGRLDGVGRDDVETILTAAKRGAALTRNLLAFSRKGKNVVELLDARAIIDGARHLLGRALPPGIEVEIDLQDGGARIEGDPSQLAQAIVNLWVNAAEAMPDGGIIRVRTSRVVLQGLEAERRAVDAGEYMVIAVQDSGSGMDSETRRLAFDPFFTTKPQAAPTSGLGLPMVYGTARNHGGSAEVESRKNEGTTVTLHLPCARAKAGTDSAAPPSGPRADLANRTVLLVDDEPSVRAVARRILERSGLRVRAAENGRRALDAWTAEGPFDLVVVDMAMPVMGGKELLLRLRRLAPTARVLVVSGFTGDGEAAEVMAAGALGFVEKPYTPSSLSRAVRAALTRDMTASAGKVGS